MNSAELLSRIKEIFVYDASSPLIFTGWMFFILFAIFYQIYVRLSTRHFWTLIYVIGFSYFFYYKSSGLYLLLLAVVTIKDYYLAALIDKYKGTKKAKRLMLMSVISSFAFLFYFKYTLFTLDTFQHIIQTNFSLPSIFLPIGISFFTFQTVSYVLDVYWGKLEPTKSLLSYAFYLSYFPQLVAGPIVRASLFLKQIESPIKLCKTQIDAGLWLIMSGIIKKAVIADYIASYNDIIFGFPEGYSGWENLMAVLGYTLQIYCDFSGYSDMAIGIGKLMGFDLGINFNVPYQSQNITEFWRRWHISLSTWLRDYLYIPLGGNRNGAVRKNINLMITMLLGGLWHGADWKFVFWGAMHGGGLITHKLCSPLLNRLPQTILTKIISWFITFAFVSFLWIFFRADSFATATIVIKKAYFTFDYNFALIAHFAQKRAVWCIMMIAGIAMHAFPEKFRELLFLKYQTFHFAGRIILFIAVLQLVVQFSSQEVMPFIYFQF